MSNVTKKPPSNKRTATKSVDKKKDAQDKETSIVKHPGVFQDVGLGFEEAEQDAYAIPFVVVLQNGSPQCNQADGSYVAGASAGQFFNTATSELLDEQILVVPCHYVRKFVEWAPRESGGGFYGSYDVSNVDVNLPRNKSQQLVLPSGNTLSDTRYHFCLLMRGHDASPVVIAFAASQLKTSRNWMTAMRNIKILHPKSGEMVQCPMMLNVWTLKTVNQSNDKGAWKGVRADFNRRLKLDDEIQVYSMAKDFHDQIVSGSIRASVPNETFHDGDGGDSAF